MKNFKFFLTVSIFLLINTHAYSKLEIDGINLGHYNLWRSDLYYRVDSDYDWLHNHGVTAFWRNNGNLSFPKRKGLHSQQFPDGISSIARLNGSLIHKGFSTDNQIITRYKNYKDRGQNGWDLDRLIDENNLKTHRLENEKIPSWYVVKDILDPIEKDKIHLKIE